MKNIIYIVCLLILVSCSEDDQVSTKEISTPDKVQTPSVEVKEVSQLEERDGVMYEPSKEEPFTGRHVIHHENGQKQVEGNYKEGMKDGHWTYWYENGQKESEGNFKEGMEDGLWILWDENGQKKSEGNYKDGELVE